VRGYYPAKERQGMKLNRVPHLGEFHVRIPRLQMPDNKGRKIILPSIRVSVCVSICAAMYGSACFVRLKTSGRIPERDSNAITHNADDAHAAITAAPGAHKAGKR